YIVQEYIDGSMYHVDSIVEGGKIIAQTVAEYNYPPADFTNPEPALSVTMDQSPTANALRALHQAVLQALEISTRVFHLEAFLTPAEEPIFCEIAGRPGGAGIPDQFLATTGYDLHRVMVNLCLSRTLAEPVRDPIASHAGFLLFFGSDGVVRFLPAPASFPEP